MVAQVINTTGGPPVYIAADTTERDALTNVKTGAVCFVRSGNTYLKSAGGWDTTTATTTTLDLSSTSPSTHPILLSSMTLPANSNVIRGTSVNPTRLSGWICFTGTVSTAPAQVYTEYQNLTTTGTAEVLGIGSFPMMATGASCASMFAAQFITQVDSGATIAASTGPGSGVFPLFAKVLINGATVNASAVAAAAWLSFQANVTDVSALDTSFLNMEIASGGIRSIFKVQDTASGGATFLFDFTDDLGKPCSLTNGSDLNDISATANAGWIKVRIGSTTRYIPLYAAKA